MRFFAAPGFEARLFTLRVTGGEDEEDGEVLEVAEPAPVCCVLSFLMERGVANGDAPPVSALACENAGLPLVGVNEVGTKAAADTGDGVVGWIDKAKIGTDLLAIGIL